MSPELYWDLPKGELRVFLWVHWGGPSGVILVDPVEDLMYIRDHFFLLEFIWRVWSREFLGYRPLKSIAKDAKTKK